MGYQARIALRASIPARSGCIAASSVLGALQLCLGARPSPERLKQCNVIFRTQEDLKRVDISGAIQASLAGRYASALYDLACESGSVSLVATDLDKLSAALTESVELQAITTNPELSRTAQGKAIGAVGAHLQLSELTTNFLGVLANNRRLSALGDMIRAFQKIAAAQRGEVTAHVTSAHALSDDQLAALKDKLTAHHGRTVKLDPSVDPDLLGGLVVTIGSQCIDGSIRTRLNSLAQVMRA